MPRREARGGQLIAVALLTLVMAVAVAGVAFMIYPVLYRVADTGVKKRLALWYVGTRITESAIFIVGVLAILAFLPLSREFVAAGSPDASHFQTSGIVVQSTADVAFGLGQSVFAIGAVMLYYLLYQSRLVLGGYHCSASSPHRCSSSAVCRSCGRGIPTPP